MPAVPSQIRVFAIHGERVASSMCVCVCVCVRVCARENV